MPPFLIPLLVKIGLGLGAIAIAITGYFVLVNGIKHRAIEAYKLEMVQETAAETLRRNEAIEAAQQKANIAVTELRTAEARYENLQKEIAQLSSRNDDRDCLDADSVQRLREIGHEAGDGTGGSTSSAPE